MKANEEMMMMMMMTTCWWSTANASEAKTNLINGRIWANYIFSYCARGCDGGSRIVYRDKNKQLTCKNVLIGQVVTNNEFVVIKLPLSLSLSSSLFHWISRSSPVHPGQAPSGQYRMKRDDDCDHWNGAGEEEATAAAGWGRIVIVFIKPCLPLNSFDVAAPFDF